MQPHSAQARQRANVCDELANGGGIYRIVGLLSL
jgi:hypothetical protein